MAALCPDSRQRTQHNRFVGRKKKNQHTVTSSFRSAAAQSPGLKDANQSIERSFLGRKVLKNANGAPLTPDEIEALRKHIGDAAVDRLISYDAMLDAVAK